MWLLDLFKRSKPKQQTSALGSIASNEIDLKPDYTGFTGWTDGLEQNWWRPELQLCANYRIDGEIRIQIFENFTHSKDGESGYWTVWVWESKKEKGNDYSFDVVMEDRLASSLSEIVQDIAEMKSLIDRFLKLQSFA